MTQQGWQVALDAINKFIIGAPAPVVRTYSDAAAREQLAEVERLFRARILHFGGNAWDSWGVRLRHDRFVVTARFSPEHPYEAPVVLLDPAPRDPHYYVHREESVARLCWCQPGEWHTSYRLVIAVGTALRFINDHQVGKTS